MKATPVFGRTYLALQALRGEPVGALVAELERLESSSPDVLATHRRAQLRAVLAAAARTPWYGARLADLPLRPEVAELDDLARLPLLTKDELRSQGELLVDPSFRGPVNAFETTGTTGVPLRIRRDRRTSAAGRAAQIRGRGWHGLPIGVREIRFGGISVERLGRGRARVIDFLMNRHRLSPFDVSEERMAGWVRQIRLLRPGLLYGYPSVLYRLATFVESQGESLRVPLVITSSERLFPFRREKIGAVFGCPVVDEYGAAEVSIIAFECERGAMHVTEENLALEVVDASGRPLPDGEPGELVVTDLRNVAMPLLRYRIGDFGRRVPGACACGRVLARMEIHEGTRFGEVHLPGGRTVSGVAFHFALEPAMSRAHGQIEDVRVVLRDDGLVVEAVWTEATKPGDLEELARRAREATYGELEVRLERVAAIDRGGSDKFRLLFDERIAAPRDGGAPGEA